MFRLSNLIKSVVEDKKERVLSANIAIWNITNRCNLFCHHCYSRSDLNSHDKLSTKDIKKTIDQFQKHNIKFIIFSGGEPLARKDIFEITAYAKEKNIITYLSTNGLYINSTNIKKIISTFDYIGISIDGDEKIHDRFRALNGSYERSLKAIKLIQDSGGKVGIRFTLTKETINSLEHIFALSKLHDIQKIYISHLVYSGRGFDNLNIDLDKEQRKKVVEFIIDKAFTYYKQNKDIEIVTGNMEPDAILFLKMFEKRYPNLKDIMYQRLLNWGGNSAGRKLLNIDSKGFVKPDPFFPKTLGNILKSDLDEILDAKNNPLLKRLKAHPREILGKCSICKYIDICNGGSRSRAYAIHGDIWAEDPSCYLDEKEISSDKIVIDSCSTF